MPANSVVIVAGGDLREPCFYRSLPLESAFIICANGGAAHALALGLKPDLLVGDADSLDEAVGRQLQEAGTPVERHPVEKDKSDLELALDRALEMKPCQIIIIGALGGARVDHGFANLLLLKKPLEAGIPASIVDESHEIRMADQELIFEGAKGDLLSLFSLAAESTGLVTEGLKYPLNRESLALASTRGLSNEFAAPRARVTLQSGLLLAIRYSRAVR